MYRYGIYNRQASIQSIFFLIILFFATICLYLRFFIGTSEQSAHAQGGSSDRSESCTSALKETASEPVRAAATLYTPRKRLPLIYGRIAQNYEIAEVDSNPVMVASLVIQSKSKYSRQFRGCLT
jgi:hypothetical protein